MSPRARIVTDNICQNGFGTSVAHIKSVCPRKGSSKQKTINKTKNIKNYDN